MAWTEQLRGARENHTVSEHPWRPILEAIKGEVGRDGVERIATDRLFDLLDVFLPEGMPRFKRTPEAQKQVKAQMVLLGWCPVRARLVTRGFAARVRAYARMPGQVPAGGNGTLPTHTLPADRTTTPLNHNIAELPAAVTSEGKRVKGSGRGVFDNSLQSGNDKRCTGRLTSPSLPNGWT
jgi:hypothetical protein